MPHPADTHDRIVIRGARVNNLKGVDLDLPKRRLTVFTGLSGSGKSSLVFGTVAAESQRLLNETYSTFLQGLMPSMARPDVDVLEGLTAAIVVDQERIGGNARSTVGTATDVNALLRILFSRIAEPHLGPPSAYSFNVPRRTASGAMKVDKGAGARVVVKDVVYHGGMCPRCEGMGTVNDIDLAELYDGAKSLAEGAIKVPGYTAEGWATRLYTASGFLDPDKPIDQFSEQELHDFLYKEPTKVRIEGINLTYEGLVPKVRKSILSKDVESLQPHVRAFVERAVTFAPCPDCGGTRLAAQVLESRIAGRNIAEVCAMQISDIGNWLSGIEELGVAPLLAKLREVLTAFEEIGLGYLSLDRATGTLSGGEAQRTKLIRHLGSALTDVTYVFDEPTVGLHPHDIERMNRLLLQLRDKGNTVLVVEHKPEVIDIADHVVDLGPGPGDRGGAVGYAGDPTGLRGSGTLTGSLIDVRPALRTQLRKPTGRIEVRGAALHNLRGVDVDIPLGQLVVVTGVAGSGKSTLIHDCLPDVGVRALDQAPIKGSIRSNPATYTGLMDHIRSAFAKANKVKPALFSANSAGACPNCKGLGVVYTELGVMASVACPCEDCDGRRFTEEVLQYRLNGLNIHEVLQLSIEAAGGVFTTGAPAKILQRLQDVGLGYITLGQALNTLSGGERQRLKLAIAMGDGPGIYVLDEPTSGLHLADIDQLLGVLDRLLDQGNSVIVIEHHRSVIAHADWVIDMGPGAGREGGRVVFQGTPAQMVATGDTVTARYLREWVTL